MKREKIKDELRQLSEKGEPGTVLPAALLDIMEAGEKSAKLAEQNMAALKGELNSIRAESKTASTEHATKIKGVLDGMQEKHDAFVADVHEHATKTKNVLDGMQEKHDAFAVDVREHATKTKNVLDDMQKKHDAFAAAIHKKLFWSIGLPAVAIVAILVLIVIIIKA